MSIAQIISGRLDCPPPRYGEVLRYAGCRGDAPELVPAVQRCVAEASTVLVYRYAYCRLPAVISDGTVALPGVTIGSRSLAKVLSGCDSVILFAATVGIGIDRLVAKYGRISPSHGIIMQGLGAERIEALCDAVSDMLAAAFAAEGYATTPRFSPGYGDLSLEHQGDFLRLLEADRRLGVTLNRSLMMSPTKSVTAIVGMKKET